MPEIQITLNNLPSIKNVNITENNETDLTVYPNKVYSAEEAQNEIEETLKVIFASHKADPFIKEDILEGLGADTNSKIID